MNIIDIFFGILLLVFFVTGFIRGFISVLLSLIAVGGACILAIYYTKDFSGLLSKIPFISSYPGIGMLIVGVLSYLILNFAAQTLGKALNKSAIFNNVALNLCAAIGNSFIFILVITVILSFLQTRGIDLGNLVEAYNDSYTKIVFDYINNGLNIPEQINQFSQTIKAHVEALDTRAN